MKKSNASKFYPLTILSILSIFFVLISFQSAAAEKVAMEGFLRGAICTHYKLGCKNDDASVDMENDFVLVTSDGSYYFLPNLSRIVKARHANDAVRVKGDKENMEIWVGTLEIKDGNSYKTVWDWEVRKKLYYPDTE